MRSPERRLLTSLLAATVVTALIQPPAWSEGCSGRGEIRDRGGDASATCPGTTERPTSPPPTSAGSAQTCTEERAADPGAWWISFDVPESVLPEGAQRGEALRPPEGQTVAVRRDCNGDVRSGVFWVPEPVPGGAGDDDGIFVARQEARARVEPSVPVFAVSPERAVVQFETWLWIDGSYWQVASASSTTPGGVTVTVEAVPVEVTWDLDEGVRVCDGPGVAWSPSAQAAYELQVASVRGTGNPACTFTFVDASSTRPSGLFDASVTVRWEFSWSLNGVDRGVFGNVEVSEDFPLRVGEVQAVITG